MATQMKTRRHTRQLPLVVFTLACGHLARDYGIRVDDIKWCDECSDHRAVAFVIAT